MNEKQFSGAAVHKVLIIGSGPAGLMAAIYAARAQLNPVVFEGLEWGGQLTTTMEVENFPGFPESVKGPQLMELMARQARRFGAEILPKSVEKADFLERPFKLWTDDAFFYRGEAVIVATGSSYKWLGLESEQHFKGHGVSACATCDGYFFRDREIVIVGGGDTAMEEALFLARLASKVTLIHRRQQFRASKIMSDRVMNHPKIEIKWNSVVEEIQGDSDSLVLNGVRIRNIVTGKEESITCAGFFVAIGRRPNTHVFEGILDTDRNGYLVTQPGTTRTSVEGVFACGEVQDNVYRQAITSAGSGAMAAMDAERWLEAYEII